LKKKKKTLR